MFILVNLILCFLYIFIIVVLNPVMCFDWHPGPSTDLGPYEFGDVENADGLVESSVLYLHLITTGFDNEFVLNH